MKKQPIGFTQELKDAEKEVAVTTDKSYKFKWIIKGAIALGVLAYGGNFIGGMISDFETPTEMADRKEAQYQEYKAKKDADKKAKEEAYQEAKKVNDSMKEVHTGSLAVASYGNDLIDMFNKEMQSTQENEIFDFKFSISGDKVLVLKVDTEKASAHFGTNITTTELGISQGSDVYRSYLNRFDSRIWNGKGENISLQIQNKHGKIISEIKK